MGAAFSEFFDGTVEYQDCEFKTTLIDVLQSLKPENLLEMALEDDVVYDLCKEDPTLRESCIRGAMRRYHIEKHFYENVCNRTADFMIVLDTLLQIQEEEENKRLRKTLGRERRTLLGCIPFGSSLRQDRVGDAAQNGEEDTNEE